MYKKFRETHLFSFLTRFDEQKCPMDAALSDYLRAHKSVGAHDRRFLADTAYALMRWRDLLDALNQKKSAWEERYALWNRLDLNYLPEDLPLHIRSGASQFIFEELSKIHKEARAFAICRALNDPAPLTVRVNLLKTTREALLDRWKSLGALPCSLSLSGIRFPERIALTSLPEFKEGLFEIQDEGSQMIADLVKPNVGEQFLDYCSGSGGKSLAIAAKMQGKGQIYLHDIRPKILDEAKRRLRRAGIQNAQFLKPDHPRLNSLKNKLDWVLADVPCSGSGTLRRNPDMKWKLDHAMLERLTADQREIFTKALYYVKPGGMIVYATCSIFARENELQVEYFLKNLPLSLVGQPLAILPESNGADGFFGAVFCKKL